jgi:predicted RNase H-like nuclease
MTQPTTFIGIDLAWQSERNTTGIAIARGDRSGAALLDVTSGIRGLDEIAAFIQRFATEHTVIAIDAPLIIRNKAGRRPCESEISRRFGARHAGAHSSNLSLYPAPSTHELVRRLGESGFQHSMAIERYTPGRWFFEVYPHPAQVMLFGLDTILKYKAKSRRPRVLRLSEFARLRSLLALLQNAEPGLSPDAAASLLSIDLASLRGRAMKNHEDALDAWFCAYLALHAWSWGSERNEIVGDFESGYIVVPTVAANLEGGDA